VCRTACRTARAEQVVGLAALAFPVTLSFTPLGDGAGPGKWGAGRERAALPAHALPRPPPPNCVPACAVCVHASWRFCGIVGLANSHTLGSLLNHSRMYAKCSYVQKDLISPDLKTTDGTRQIGCIFICSYRKIYQHEQLLTNYEQNTATQIQNMLHFV